MDAVMSFAAARRDRMKDADSELSPLVLAALSGWSESDSWFSDLEEGASVLWLEIFSAEAPNADPDLFLPRFREMLGEALSQTSKPDDPPTEAQVNRVTNWLSAATVNNATYLGNRAHGGSGMRWVTMSDASVRETHRAVNGQIADSEGTFDVGGFDLHYPGEPVGPPEIWINCRCILAPARVEGALSMDAITADMAGIVADVDDVDSMPEGDLDSDELPTDEPEDDEEEITEIPVHGVAAIEGRATGDGRKFAVGSVSFGALPQPLGFEFESSHDGSNSRVAIIGRIDEFFKVEIDGIVEVRWRGVIFPGKPYAAQAIESILDRSYTGLSVIVDSVALDVDATESDALSTDDGHILTQTYSEIRIRRFDMVPTGAYQEGWINLGDLFADELDEDALAACATCNGPEDEDDASVELGYDVYSDQTIVVNLGQISAEELERYDALSPEEQILYAAEAGMIESVESYREISTEERRKLAKEGKALPDGSFPIANVEDLRNAIQAIGRASDPKAAKALIRKRAKELDQEDLIPESWSLVAAAFAPGTKDGPGWITHPIPTGRIRRYWTHGKGAAKIRWGVPGDFNRCRRQLAKYIANPEWLAGACANMHKEAIGIWPGQESGGRGHRSEGVAMNIVASGIATKPAEAFRDPGLDGLTPFTIEGDRVFGHLAAWGVCHIGIQDKCVTAPNSHTNYGYFRTGVVATDDGRVPVGQITMGTGHASIKANAKAAVAHYDNTGSVVADVAAGEDAYGIWVAGVLRPGLTSDQIAALAASALSGDWRRTANGLELVAALAVNVPGFPIPRTALAASGMAEGDEGQRLDEIQVTDIDAVFGINPVERVSITAGLLPSPEEIAGIVRTAVDEYRSAEVREGRLSALQPFAEKARERSLSRINDYFQED